MLHFTLEICLANIRANSRSWYIWGSSIWSWSHQLFWSYFLYLSNNWWWNSRRSVGFGKYKCSYPRYWILWSKHTYRLNQVVCDFCI